MRIHVLRILHLFANWKWTGPAEPAVNLAAQLRQRGHTVEFLCGREVEPLPNDVADEARRRGLEPRLVLRLGKHRNPIWDALDRRALRAWLRKHRPDVIHCHLPNDHRIALGAAEGLGIPIVRSLYDGDPPPVTKDTKTLLRGGCAGVVAISERVRNSVVQRFGLEEERAIWVDGAVDLRRFNPRAKGLPDLRKDYGIEPEDFVVGIVARMQRHRRFEVFFEAMTQVARRVPRMKILLVGRGTWMDEVAVKPAARKDLQGKAIFTGYRRGSEYVATLRCMHAKVYLVPGSDGSCRAAREALAMGVPVVAARRGHLVDLIEDGVNGILVGDSPDELASALIRLAEDASFRERLSASAHDIAHRRYGLALQARRIEAFYEVILGKRAAGTA
ncbi:MAG: D-inositol-3-phosphate glycosyltransferase [Planctomycetes bacterium]|nr:D-inositol-3-phosphate glycosyltransferase [Planctomycetota bacterium]